MGFLLVTRFSGLQANRQIGTQTGVAKVVAGSIISGY